MSELMRADCICPAPMMTEIDRQKRISEMRESIYSNKCVIEKEWRFHNPAFDNKGEKSTTMFRVRPLKTLDELEFIIRELGL